MTTSLSELFQLPIPAENATDWGDTMRDWLNLAEKTLGCNTNLAIVCDTTFGIATKHTLAYLVDDESAQKANPATGRWGRSLLQTTMVHGELVLARLLGVSKMTGLPVSYDDSTPMSGRTLYHNAASHLVTPYPDEAVVSASGRLVFLPLGYSYDFGASAFINTTLPLQVCPVVLSGRGIAFKDGSSNPAGTWAIVIDSGPVFKVSFTGASQDIDLYFPVPIPGDFDSWLSTDEDAFWAAKVDYKVSGGAAVVSVQSVIDTDGVEHAIAGVSGALTSFDVVTLRMKKLADLTTAVWTPGKVAYIRVRATGNNAEDAYVRPHIMLQYFPFFRWQL